jgi:hypothetical protein
VVDLERWVQEAVAANREWAEASGPFTPHPSLEISDERFGAAFAEFADRLADNYPFFHPRYAGQMLKPPHPAAVAGPPSSAWLFGLISMAARYPATAAGCGGLSICPAYRGWKKG